MKALVSSYYCGRCVPYLQSIGMGGKSHVFSHIWIRIGKGPQRPQSSGLNLNRGSNATRSCSQSPIGSDRRNCIHFTPDRFVDRTLLDADVVSDDWCGELSPLNARRGPQSRSNGNCERQRQPNIKMRHDPTSGSTWRLPMWDSATRVQPVAMGPPPGKTPRMGHPMKAPC